MSRQYQYSDIEITLEKQTDGDVLRDTEIDAVKNSIKNIVETLPGSRRMLPTFAGDFWYMLFDPMDEITSREIASSLIESIRVWDDRVIIEGLDIEMDYDNSQYDCILSFKIKETGNVENIKFILKKT